MAPRERAEIFFIIIFWPNERILRGCFIVQGVLPLCLCASLLLYLSKYQMIICMLHRYSAGSLVLTDREEVFLSLN